MFIGSALAAYCNRHGVGRAELAAFLNCSVEKLPSLSRCFRPRDTKELSGIARGFGVDRERLIEVLRESPA